MNCEQFRTIVGAEPNSTDPEGLAHVEQCPECARYRQDMQAMDQLIYRALAIDVAEPKTPISHPEESGAKKFITSPGGADCTDAGGRATQGAVAEVARSAGEGVRAESNKPRLWRMAASLLITAFLVAATSLWLLSPRDSFATEVIEHVQDEQASLIRTDATVDPARVEKILAASNMRLKPGAAHVSYAMGCEFRGHYIPHLVVQTEQGPVTVLVMPQAERQQRKEIDEQGFQGVILPAPRGMIVVLGQNVSVDAVASTVLGALEYW